MNPYLNSQKSSTKKKYLHAQKGTIAPTFNWGSGSTSGVPISNIAPLNKEYAVHTTVPSKPGYVPVVLPEVKPKESVKPTQTPNNSAIVNGTKYDFQWSNPANTSDINTLRSNPYKQSEVSDDPSLFMQGVYAGNQAIGDAANFALYSMGELFNTPFSLALEGYNNLSGKAYDYKSALPDPERLHYNLTGDQEMLDLRGIKQQKTLTEALDINRETDPVAAFIADALTPTFPIAAFGKANNVIKHIKTPKLTSIDKIAINPFEFAKSISLPKANIDINKGLSGAAESVMPGMSNNPVMAGFMPNIKMPSLSDTWKALTFQDFLMKQKVKKLRLQANAMWDKTRLHYQEGLAKEQDFNNQTNKLINDVYEKDPEFTSSTNALETANKNLEENKKFIQGKHAYTTSNNKIYVFDQDINPFDNVVKTGVNNIIDLKTGNNVFVEVRLPKRDVVYFEDNKKLKVINKGIDEASVNPEYIETLKSNIAHVEELVPGSKAFGSSVGVSEANLPHITGDLDFLITESNYKRHLENNPNAKYVRPYGPAQQFDLFDGKFGEDGVFDFNIVHEDANGMVKPKYKNGRSLEVELFRQFYPDMFFEQSKIAIQNATELKIPLTAEELLNSVDPKIKTIMDSYESSAWNKSNKTKHVLRPDAYINFGDPDIVAKAQESYIKSLVGSKGKLGHQFFPEDFADIEKNYNTLTEIGFIGDMDLVAKDPKRMQLALNDFYIQESTYSRVVGYSDNLKVVESSLIDWDPQRAGAGASYRGHMLNLIRLGQSSPGTSSNSLISAIYQFDIDANTLSPLEYVKDLKNKTRGTTVLTEQNIADIDNILRKHVPEEFIDRTKMDRLKTTEDILRIPLKDNTGRVYDFDKSFSYSSLPFKPKEVFEEIAKKLNVTTVTRMENKMNNSLYASLLKKIDLSKDALLYTLKDIAIEPKSFRERQELWQQYSPQKQQKILSSIDDYYKMRNLLTGGIQTSRDRIKLLEDKIAALKKQKEKYVDKIKDVRAVEHQKMIDNFDAEKWKLINQETQLSMKIADLDVHRGNISQLRSHLSLIGVSGGLLTTVVSLVHEGRNEDFHKKKIEEDKERYREKAIKEYDEYKAQNPNQNDSVYTKKMIEIENKYFEKGSKRFRPKEKEEYRAELDKRHNAWIEQIRKNEEQYRQLLNQSK